MRSILAIVNVLGALLALFSAYYLLPVATALLYGERDALAAFAACGVATLVLGGVLLLATRRHRAELKPRDGYLLVSLGWLLLTASAAEPFRLILGMSVTDAYFEAMSGLSTTGSSVITGLDALPRSVNLWRHALHWLGGMGIIVLAVAVLPLLGVGGMQMYRAEAPGPVKDAKLTPRITETAKALWLVYAGITAVCFVTFWLAGMSAFDAVCHAFSVLSLGGFSTHDASVGYFDSPLIELLFIFFMVIAALNFATHFLALRRREPSAYRRDPEARWVVLGLAAGVMVAALMVHAEAVYPDFPTSLRHAAFNVVSLATTAGFVTQDYSAWPLFVPVMMLFMSSVLPSTGSTGGGIKLFRALIMLKQWFRETFALVHPHAVIPLKIAGQVVSNRVVNSVLAFVFVYFMTVVILTFVMLATKLDFATALSAVLASVNNAGPGLGQVGPATNYAGFNDLQTWICTLAMFLGRIELFTFLILFTRTFWRK
ncbi:MAG: potassium transporter TrkG [Pseudomonadota bacterium]|jgi:trk system potassium uptake protein TrkH|nr:MAG: potassium transporter Trk [Pseudomonadota bacterium]